MKRDRAESPKNNAESTSVIFSKVFSAPLLVLWFAPASSDPPPNAAPAPAPDCCSNTKIISNTDTTTKAPGRMLEIVSIMCSILPNKAFYANKILLVSTMVL